MSTHTTSAAQPPPATGDGRQARRRARAQLIRDGARVRQALGQAALYERVDGVHVITHRGQRFRGPTGRRGDPGREGGYSVTTPTTSPSQAAGDGRQATIPSLTETCDMDAKELDALKRLIVDYIEDRDYVSFPQLERHGAQAGYAMEGTAALELGGKNVVVWMGMSQAFCDAIRELLDEKTIFLCPTTSLTYLADGKILILPIAKRPPANGYTKPHWCPAVMRIVPF